MLVAISLLSFQKNFSLQKTMPVLEDPPMSTYKDVVNLQMYPSSISIPSLVQLWSLMQRNLNSQPLGDGESEWSCLIIQCLKSQCQNLQWLNKDYCTIGKEQGQWPWYGWQMFHNDFDAWFFLVPNSYKVFRRKETKTLMDSWEKNQHISTTPYTTLSLRAQASQQTNCLCRNPTDHRRPKSASWYINVVTFLRVHVFLDEIHASISTLCNVLR